MRFRKGIHMEKVTEDHPHVNTKMVWWRFNHRLHQYMEKSLLSIKTLHVGVRDFRKERVYYWREGETSITLSNSLVLSRVEQHELTHLIQFICD